MLENKILGLIELNPEGLSNGQLLWRLNSSGTPYDSSELLEALDRLAQAGKIGTSGTRWRVAGTAGPRAENGRGKDSTRQEPDNSVLRAAPGTIRAPVEHQDQPLEGSDALATGAPDASALLRYYAATQRRDPRGSVEAFPDGHGSKWHLFECRGSWWDVAGLNILAGLLGPSFLQALAQMGEEGEAAVGWPVSVFRDQTGTVCVSGLLLPVSWHLKGQTLAVRVDAVQPALNPAFVRHVRRRTGLGEDDLLRALERDDAGGTLEAVARRLAHLLARIGGQALRPAELAHELSLSGEGLHNAAALFLPDDAAFTRRLAEDLDRIAGWPGERRSGTALGELLGPRLKRNSVAGIVEIDTLTEPQFLAADAALSGPLTVIQGPPGTGKSHVIVTLIVSALASGQSVLFAARNHRALDEVEGRLARLLPDAGVVVRARDAEGERDTSMLDALSELANGAAVDSAAALAAADCRQIVTEAALAGSAARRAEAERARIKLALADLVDREEDLVAVYAAAGASSRSQQSFLAWLRSLLSRDRPDPLGPLHPDARPDEIRRRITALRNRLASLPVPSELASPDFGKHLKALAQTLALPEEDKLQHLRARKSDIDFQPGRSKQRHLTDEDARLVLRHRPIWLASTLSVPARIPLVPAMFDLAIFDESSQCDIASALAVMVRANRAVVVGDPEQLSFIPALGVAQENALMDAARLSKAGRGSWAQSRNSLFDFVRARIDADRLHLLPDQFRSAPDIVDYTSKAFYGGKLRARRSDDEFGPPSGYRPGLHWEDVRGPCSREDGGNVNRTEAEWIAKRLAALADDSGFEGTVGVISPFNAQVGLIRRLAEAAVPAATRQRMRLNVDTVDGWQGGEADAIFFSLSVGPGAAQSALAFLQRERRRFNVAVSRARAVAVVVGDLDWARRCGIAHVEFLADRATRPPGMPQRGFDSKWERRVHEALLSRGLEPKPQYPLGSRSLDFALFYGTVKLDLEVDGRKWHTGAGGERKVSDRLRDRELIAKGWRVRRFWVDELAADMEGCLDIIERDLGRRA